MSSNTNTPSDLVLYAKSTCPYCQRVLARAAELNLTLTQRDVQADPEARAELLRVGGRATVPCLFIAGKPLYESADIIAYLERRMAASA